MNDEKDKTRTEGDEPTDEEIEEFKDQQFRDAIEEDEREQEETDDPGPGPDIEASVPCPRWFDGMTDDRLKVLQKGDLADIARALRFDAGTWEHLTLIDLRDLVRKALGIVNEKTSP